MAIAKKTAPQAIPRFAPGSPPAPSRFAPKAPAPVQAEIKAPPHEYLRPHEVGFPFSKILANEAGITYASLHPASRYARLMGFLLMMTLYAAISASVIFPASSVFPAWAGLLCATAIILPFALSELVEIIFLIETYRFSLQPEFLFVRAGAIDPKYELIPYENIQDAQVSQGLAARVFNVSSVSISTPASTLFISFLPNETARQFREDLLSLARQHKNMAE